MLSPEFSARFPRDPRTLLTQREAEVLRMAALGLTNHEVARHLQVTVHTVKFHLAAIYKKLGVANRTEAAVLYQAAALGSASGDTAA